MALIMNNAGGGDKVVGGAWADYNANTVVEVGKSYVFCRGYYWNSSSPAPTFAVNGGGTILCDFVDPGGYGTGNVGSKTVVVKATATHIDISPTTWKYAPLD